MVDDAHRSHSAAERRRASRSPRARLLLGHGFEVVRGRRVADRRASISRWGEIRRVAARQASAGGGPHSAAAMVDDAVALTIGRRRRSARIDVEGGVASDGVQVVEETGGREAGAGDVSATVAALPIVGTCWRRPSRGPVSERTARR